MHYCDGGSAGLTDKKFVRLSRAARNRIFDIMGMGQVVLALIFGGTGRPLS